MRAACRRAVPIVTIVVAVLLTSGCAPDGPVGREPRQGRPRAATTPRENVKVINAALGRDRATVARAVRDLKAVGLWGDLTRHLYAVKLSTRAGRDRIPGDQHLADAVYTALIEEEGAGGLCDIVFFSSAITRDLRRQALYHRQGRVAEPPPGARAFWGSLLAHELAHCHGDAGLGERGARRWEARALRELEREG